MKKQILITAILALFLVSCQKSNNDAGQVPRMSKKAELMKLNRTKVTISEGIFGTIIQTEGDCMPSIDGNNSCKEFPVVRNIRVYEYTLMERTAGDRNNFARVDTELVAVVESDAEGFFEVTLPPGTYSIFVEEKGSLYANSFDGVGGIHPVTVKAGKASETTLNLNYACY